MATWVYLTPSYSGGPRVYEPSSNPAFDQHMLAGVSTLYTTVVKSGSSYTSYRIPTLDQLSGADKIYHGGGHHVVTDAEKTLIEASGVGGTFTEVT